MFLSGLLTLFAFDLVGVSWAWRDGASERKTSTSSGTSSRKLEGTSPFCPLSSPCQHREAPVNPLLHPHGASQGAEEMFSSISKLARERKFPAKVPGDAESSHIHSHTFTPTFPPLPSLPGWCLVVLVLGKPTHIIKSIFIDLTKDSDDVPSAERQLGLKGGSRDSSSGKGEPFLSLTANPFSFPPTPSC